MTTPALQIEGLSVGYGRRGVLRELSLHVPAGTTTVLLGRNGEGKTTLLKACLGVLRPTAGRVRIAGRDPQRRAAAVRRIVGYVPDRPDVWPWMTPREWLRFLGAHLPALRLARGLELLERLLVPPDLAFGRMSRGQGMKAMLATALAHDPQVLLLDEPFGGLDAVVRDEVLESVILALGGEPRAVLVATHDLDVAARIADRVALLAGGRIVRDEPAQDPHAPALTPQRLQEALAAVSTGGVA